jgi:hypothetical protein
MNVTGGMNNVSVRGHISSRHFFTPAQKNKRGITKRAFTGPFNEIFSSLRQGIKNTESLSSLNTEES